MQGVASIEEARGRGESGGTDGDDIPGPSTHGGLHGGCGDEAVAGGELVEPAAKKVEETTVRRISSYNGMMRVDLAAAFAVPKLTAAEAAMQV